MILLLLSLTAFAGTAQQSFNTTDGYSLEVKRQGRATMGMNLLTGNKSEDIICTMFYMGSSMNFIAPAMWANHFATASTRATGTAQMGDVVPFGVSPTLTENWVLMPKACALGIAVTGPDTVTVTVANFGKMNGRQFSLDAMQSRLLADFIRATP